jgi:hypothetical protein
MIVALARARRWLFPLAVFSGAVAAVQLVGYTYGTDSFSAIYAIQESHAGAWTGVNVAQLMLAVTCAVVGFIALRRDAHSTGQAENDHE